MDQMPLNIDPSLMQTGSVSRGGMFGGGGKFGLKEALAFGLAGLVSRRNPALLQGLMGMVAQKQKQAQEDAQYQQRRQDTLLDYEKKQQIDQRYPTAPQPTEYERLLAAMGVQPGTPQYQEHIGRFVGAKENPIVMTPYGPMPYSAVNGGGQQAPAKPLTDEDILRMQGGPTPQASGGFPRPY